MQKEEAEGKLGELLAEIYHKLHRDPNRAKEFMKNPAIRAWLNGQWDILHRVCLCLNLDMSSVRASMVEKLNKLAA